MKVFDFFKNAVEKVETITKKIEEDPAKAFSEFMANKSRNVRNSKPAQKTDRPVDGISEQILHARDSMIRNGFAEYEFIANRDCCNICAGLNGKHFPIDQLEIGKNAPPMHDGCRCSIAAYEDDEEYEAWLDHLANGGTSKEWKKQRKSK